MIAVLGLVTCAALLAFFFRRHRFLVGAREHVLAALRDAKKVAGVRYLVGASALTLVGMALAGASLATLALAGASAVTSANIITSVAVFSAAWIAGFLAPGAPAGLGVREAILLAGLTPMLGRAGAVEVAILFRALSVGADLVALLAGILMLRPGRRQPA